MRDRLRFLFSRISEKLWVKPLIMCLVAIIGVMLAKLADYVGLGDIVPKVNLESVNTLLKVMSASMLVMATFSLASMVAAYSSAASSATPRSFNLVIADDVSQNALSAFIGAFIFSIVALIFLENDFYDSAGRFTLFAITLVAFGIVIITFVRWVDSIARLGRLGTTIDKVERATLAALRRRKFAPTLGGAPLEKRPEGAQPVFANTVGYVQRIDLSTLQAFAVQTGSRVEVFSLPGSFAAPDRPLAYVTSDPSEPPDMEKVRTAFKIDHDRTYDDDPRFGLIALTEIASRALSPGINDPGTAIDVIGTMVRLFVFFGEPIDDAEVKIDFDLVQVPEISMEDLFEDAFAPIARDGAGCIEVVTRLLKALKSLASVENSAMRTAAIHQCELTLARAEMALDFPNDLKRARESAGVI